ncbi:MAG TPA: DUF748 domain-containing protein, partial [Geobacteraceae bacterium]|nr:DUF748 domain-containing protein [Geobacteraceae bacterium]
MQKWKKPALWVAAILVLLMAIVAFVLPGIVKEQAIKGIETATGRKVTIARISLNPINWSVRVEGFRLMEKKENVAFASFSSVRVSISPFSLIRMAPIVSQARIASPYVRIVRNAANDYNFSDLMKGKKSEKPQRFSVNNIIIDNGSVDFIDRALPQEKSHTVRRISVGVPFISNIKYYSDQYVQPRFSAVVNGSPLKLEGKLRPFLKGAEASFSVNLHELSLPYYFSYYPGQPPVLMDSGRLSTRLDILHRVASGKNPEFELKGNVVLEEIAMRDRVGEPLLSLGRGEARISRGEVMARDFALSKLSADSLEIYLSRDKSGVWNYQRLTGEEKSPTDKEPAKKSFISVAETTLTNGRLHLRDSLPTAGFTTDLGEITFGMQGFSTAPGKKGRYDLSFASARGEKGVIKGEFSIDPLATETTLEFKEIALDAYYPYLAGELTAPVKGRLDAAAAISLTPADGLRLTKLDIETRQVTIPFGKNEGVKLAKAVVSGGRGSLKERTFEVDTVDLQNGSIKLSRDAKGALSPLALLRETKKSTKSVNEKKEPGSPFKYNIKNLSGSGLNITFTDRMKEDSPSFNLKKLHFSLANITGPRFLPIPFKIAAGYGKKGAINVSGNVNPDPLRLKAQCNLKRIPLTDA